MFRPDKHGRGCYGCFGSCIRQRADAKSIEDLDPHCLFCYTEEEIEIMKKAKPSTRKEMKNENSEKNVQM